MMNETEISSSDDFESLQIKVASPEKILSWSRGEVTEAETINYRTQKPEKGGLFCEAIFGPIKDYQCSCGKYRGVRYKGIKCDRCGVVITHSSARRSWLGHISLCVPICHIWYLKTPPHILELVLNIPTLALEQIIYYNTYIITNVNERELKETQNEIEKEYKTKLKNTSQEEKSDITLKYKQALKELEILRVKRVINEKEYYYLIKKYGNIFEAETGSDPILNFLKNLDLSEEIKQLEKELEKKAIGQKPRILKRLKILKSLQKSNTKPEWLFLTNLPVLPPDLRPMVPLDGGRYASSDLNDLYRRVITRNNRLKKLINSNAPSVIVKNEKRMLQEAVDMLFDNSLRQGRQQALKKAQRKPLRSLADILKGKQGRFRQNLLGKRVDYSGRSVIVVGPTLKFDECGVPKEMALEIFKPFVIHELLAKEIVHTIPMANRLIDEKTDEVWALLEEVIRGKYVLLNRAPTLHRLSIQAFHPVLTEGLAIQMHPMVCQPFNADFDGDTMSLHLPLSDDAQKECNDIMCSVLGMLKPSNGEATMEPTREIILGCYWLTISFDHRIGENKIFSNGQEAIFAYSNKKLDLQAKIKVKNPKAKSFTNCQSNSSSNNQETPQLIETTVGRIIFNNLLPDDYPYQNFAFNKKELKNLTNNLIHKYGFEKTSYYLDKIKDIGFFYATNSGLTWNLFDLKTPKNKQEFIEQEVNANKIIYKQYEDGLLSEEEKHLKIVENNLQIVNKIKEEVSALEPENPIKIILDSGSRGTYDQLNQMTGIKGLVVKPNGDVIELPVHSSYKEGFNMLEYFIATHGSRKGLVDTAIKTSQSGYLTRKLVDAAQDIIIQNQDCGDDTGIEIPRTTGKELEQTFEARIVSRVLAKDVKLNKKTIKKNTYIDAELAKEISNDPGINSVWTFSPLTCKNTSGLCQKCYGLDLAKWQPIAIGEATGIIAAQAIGEPGTQLTLRTFHGGGVVSSSDITLGLPYVESLLECRHPKDEAILSDVNGVVKDITENPLKLTIEVGEKTRNPFWKKYSHSKKIKQFLEKGDELSYSITPNKSILVNVGDRVEIGQKLTTGGVNLKKYFKLVGTQKTQDYIKKEIQQIFLLAGQEIHEKHFEVIIRKMFSQLIITKNGDSDFIPNEVVSIKRFIETNYNLLKNKKKPAQAYRLIRGIKSVALNSDSFLAAVSFEETSHSLIKAAIEGKIDNLEGLKANVIIGRLIPAGTGFRH